MSYNGHDIYRLMKQEGEGTKRLEEAKDASDELSKAYLDIEEELDGTTSTLKEFWKGEGAESGIAALEPLQQVHHGYSSDMRFGRDSMSGQIMTFNNTRDSLKQMPAERPEPLDR